MIWATLNSRAARSCFSNSAMLLAL
jgi:hypothetical protein